MTKLTPMMEQYFEIKNDYKDCILFYRLGDFYEMFFDDALTASKELEITLTGKNCGQEERAPMCGIPFHSAENYILRLITKGYKVALCEQVSDPKQSKGLVKREVVKVITPGTILNTEKIEQNKNNYIMCMDCKKGKIGISVVDITTGEFLTTEFNDKSKIMDEIAKYSPVELIYSEYFEEEIENIKARFNTFSNKCAEWNFDYEVCYNKLCDHFKVISLDGHGLNEYFAGITAAGALLNYLYETQKRDLNHISKIKPYLINDFMMLDISSRRNLELIETLREKNRQGSLLWVLDKTKTAMGGRMLRKWLEQPLLNKTEINKRLNGVEEFLNAIIVREELKELFNGIYDIERLIGKISYGNANARDLIALKNSITLLPDIKNILANCSAIYQKEIYEDFDTLEDISKLIEESINEEPPITLREGKLIKIGYDKEVDKLREASINGKTWIAELEQKEKEITGIKNLKIKYNKVFGYYLEITNSQLNLAPERYIRKQTLSNCERYIIPELKEIEETIIGAEEKLIVIENEIFIQVRNSIAKNVLRVQKVASHIASLDAIRSLAEVAEKQNYVKPSICMDGKIDIIDGRHPVVEQMIGNGQFIANDIYLDNNDQRLSIITGPNMAGKSTYMRQVALIVLMAQIGSFVPAKTATISIVDRIFTRVGASDDLASGQSTFMVEMTEVSNILHNATKDSLLILDEIGRGTSTFDGLSIAWAVVEYISNKNIIGAKTLFATHYHELTELEGKIEGVQNYCVTIKENNDDIIFLRKIKRGGADHSYGIEVGKLAGLPTVVVDRAKEILEELKQSDITLKASEIKVNKEIIDNNEEVIQVNEDVIQNNEEIFEMNFNNNIDNEVILKLKEINILDMNPIEAMQKLFELQKIAKKL